MLGASTYAPNNRRLLSHARSTEVSTEQTYTQSCSEHRSMHGATVYYSCSEHRSIHGATIYSVVLGASRVCRDNPFFNYVRLNFGQLSFPLLFSISATRMRISAILWYSEHARNILFSSTCSMFRSKCENAH